MGKVASGGLKVFAAAAGAAATGVATIGTAAINSYADFEQLKGGVETLFGTQGAKSMQEYANLVGKSVSEIQKEYIELSKSEHEVMKNASEAYKTAGLSQNAYMESVTSFAAALKQSTSSELEAAKAADQAIIDMADNANKMGTSMESIQNAYQGFAKQNYTMLDNLKLGYGGTKTEMERLLKDAEKFSGVKYDINNLADVYEAIHVVQTELGITGTTAKEAASTISGSMNMAKASWENLLVGMADENADFGALVDNLVESCAAVMENILPRVGVALEGVGNLVEELLPVIIERVPQILSDILPGLLQTGADMLTSIVQGLQDNLPNIIAMAQNIITILVDSLIENAPALLAAAVEIIIKLAMFLVSEIWRLLQRIPEIARRIIEAFAEIDWGEIGSNIIDGIWAGISAGWNWIVGKVKSLARSLFGAAKEELDVNSPSKKFKWLAEMCVAGWDEGAEDLMNTDAMLKNVRANMSTLQMNANGAKVYGGGGVQQTVNIYQPVKTPDETARAIRLEARYGLVKGEPLCLIK